MQYTNYLWRTRDGTDFIVLGSRGGGYGPGTPRAGWDHNEAWLPHAVSLTGLQPRFIIVELTTADANPAMINLNPLAAESLARALAAIDQLWTADENAAPLRRDGELAAGGLQDRTGDVAGVR